MKRSFLALLLTVLTGSLTDSSVGGEDSDGAPWLAPAAMAVSPDGKTLYVAGERGKRVQVVDLERREVRASFQVAEAPSGLTLSEDGSHLYVTCAAPESRMVAVDTRSGRELFSIPAGHTATAPVLGRDGKALYVCCRFENSVRILDLEGKKETGRIQVQREPVASALTRDGRFLLVVNLLPNGRADADRVAASVSILDLEKRRVVKELVLPNGSTEVNGIAVSPDGKYAAVTHIVARFNLPATQLERGWMNTNAKSLLDLDRLEVVSTVLLDGVEIGAANPWGVGWSKDGRKLILAHAGTHELSVIDFPALLRRIEGAKVARSGTSGVEPTSAALDPVNDLAILNGIRQRIRLPAGDRGPRSLVVHGSLAITANYFSDTLSLVEASSQAAEVLSVALGPPSEWDVLRKGNFLFHDASICFQGWQSCSSCHPGEGRVDALNWDLTNDGIGNPKNTKSLFLAHRTPPSMSLGVRANAKAAVQAGIRHVLFTVQPEETSSAIFEYLRNLQGVPSPRLVNGQLSASAQRGERIFHNAGCVSCHPVGLFTDLQSYDVGTRGALDRTVDRFDTPTLIETWRTGPYLHDGSAATLQQVFTVHNAQDEHGNTSHLSAQEIQDLCEYVLSL